ncbi:geranylgeranyl-diphosphate geranylgeranyltransferase [Halobacteriales archaeon QS_8_69_26]|nr:MAG: geranylgeranyl-diphosphate geranylgeranyltransferase [Halobacteriales archaeon QS_8_69_26]
MVEPEGIARSKAIHRRTGRTFYYATRLLPERVRHPTYVLYGFFRVADEVVDSEAASRRSADEKRQRLERLHEEALGEREPSDPVLAAFLDLRERHGIPDAEVDAFVDAMLADIGKDRYETYEELEAYMRGSAAAVGVMMTHVMGADADDAVPHAVALGEAFQLTNFLRDVREDVVERDRVYLPAETLRRHGASVEQVRELSFDDDVAAAVAAELRRAERKYREGVAGIRYLPEDCRLAVLLAAVLYAEHHRLIRARGYDTVSATPSLGTARKVALVARTWIHWKRTRDPEAVFRRVSAVPDGERPDEPSPLDPDAIPTFGTGG